MIQLYQTLDMRPIGIPQTLRLSQYDSDFEIIFELTNFDGTWILDTNTTAEVQGTKTDGHGYSADVVFDDQLKTVTIAGDIQMTAAAGRNTFEVVLFHDGDRLGSKNFILDVERAALDAETTQSDSQIKNFTEMVESAEEAAETATAAAEEAVEAAASIIPGLSDEAKEALLACFAHVAWIDEHGQDYYDALEDALYSDKELVSITAVFDAGENTIYTDDPLDSLKQYLTVTALYDDSTTGRITSYALVGELTEGTSVITAVYAGKSAAFNVPDVVDFYNVYHWNSATDSDVIEVASGMCDTYTYESASTLAYDPDRADRNVLLAKRGNSTLINFDTGEPTDRYLIPVPEDATNVKITWTGASKIALQQRATHNVPEHIFRWVSDSGWQASSPYTTTINTSQTNGKANYMTLYIQDYNAGANPAFDVLFT